MKMQDKMYNQILSETADFFSAQGVSILGEGYREIATNPVLFESYVEQLTEGCDADSAAEIAQLMVNSNANILRESSLTGIQPIASLSMPVIRKLWPMFALKHAVEREVAKTPRFVISYTKPYMFKGEDTVDNRVYLPRDIRAEGENINMPASLKKESVEAKVVLAAGAAKVVQFITDVANTPSAAKKQPLDELVIYAQYGEAAKTGENVTGVVAGAKDINTNKRLGVYGNGIYEFAEGQLLVQFDGKNQKATVAFIANDPADTKVVAVELKAFKSSEYNEESWSVGFDIARHDVDIPSGQHLNAPLPIEALNDMMALYQIDGAKEVTDLMTNVFAQKLDVEILDFLVDSFVKRPVHNEFADYGIDLDFAVQFDCRPAAGFAGGPKEWREEIKPLIDHLAQRIKNETYLQNGVFVLVANPLDAQILANVDWSYRSGQGGNMDGVNVDYSVGTYVGANAYKVVASVNVPQGAMYVVFLPGSKTQMTYKYYPYTFSVEHGYVDPNRSRVPSIMMTKRHTFESFIPAIGCIKIVNNMLDGSWFATNWEDKKWPNA